MIVVLLTDGIFEIYWGATFEIKTIIYSMVKIELYYWWLLLLLNMEIWVEQVLVEQNKIGIEPIKLQHHGIIYESEHSVIEYV